ncbi:MAG: 50S ribosomal protein L30 [Gemmatimonadetes bacterium]|nr:50S ribosomal protein L30 [Gemmatimonadota bacterium]
MARKKTAAKPAKLRIRQIRSGNGRPAGHRATLRALGLRRHQHEVVQADTPAIRGMIFQVRHLVEVEPVTDGRSE